MKEFLIRYFSIIFKIILFLVFFYCLSLIPDIIKKNKRHEKIVRVLVVLIVALITWYCVKALLKT